MTICNVSVRHHSIFLATDTAATTPDGPSIQIGKLFTFPHWAGAAIGRGHAAAAAAFASALNLTPGDFDDVQRAAPVVLGEMFKVIAPQLPAFGHRDTAEQSILVAGYSRHARRMAAVMFRQETAAEGFKAWEVTDEEPSLEPHCVGDRCEHSVHGMIEAGRAQYAKREDTLAHAGMVSCGGKLIVAEITPGRVVVEPVWDLDADRDLRPARSRTYSGVISGAASMTFAPPAQAAG